MKKIYPSRRFLPLLAGASALAFLPVLRHELLVPVALVHFLLAAAAAADLLLTRALDESSLGVETAAEIGVGRSGTLAFHWRPPRPGPVPTQFEILPPPELELARTVWSLVTTGTAPARVETAYRAVTRGTAVVRAWRIRHRSVLGLWVLERTPGARAKIAVLPDVEDIKREALQVGRASPHTPGLKSWQRPDRQGEFDSLSKYVPGMDLRMVDWKSSAKHRRLLSRTFTLEQNHHVFLALDTGRLMGTRTKGLTKLDLAMTAALRLGYLALRTGDHVGLFGFSDGLEAFLPSAKGTAHFRRLVDAGEQLKPSPEEPNFQRAFHLFARRQRRRSLLVVFTDFVDRVSASLLLEALATVSRRHLVLFVACQDAELGARILAPPDTLEDLHEINEVFRLLEERKKVLAELRRMNILTLDAEPSEVTVPLLNTYLKVKAEQRL